MEVIIQIEIDEGIIIIGKANDAGQPVMNRQQAGRTPSPAPGSANSTAFFFGLSGVARLKVIKEKHDILLGESKYYYAVDDPSDPSALLIRESSAPITDAPAIAAEFSVDPIGPALPATTRLPAFQNSVITGSAATEKLGVYWENKYPLWTPNNTFAGTMDLPRGVIRLVGRYWEEEKPLYRVRLTASAPPDKEASIEIVVKKPGNLGTTYRKSKNVIDDEINIDDTCMVYAGKYGVPPQLIKGQMDQESGKYDFGGTIGKGFAPSYRYEPYTIQFWNWTALRSSKPFYVSETNINVPAVPAHNHVQVYPYPFPNKSVWDMVYDHSQLVNEVLDDEHRVYGIRRTNGTMNFSPYKRVDSIYNEFLDVYLDDDVPIVEAAANANEDMIEFLRDTWDGGVKGGTKGLKNIKAQTRIASSYGLLQMTYPLALSRTYPDDVNHLPENLNMTYPIIDLCMVYQKDILKRRLTPAVESANNWPEGYENGFYLLVYPEWNVIGSYPAEVFKKSRSYLPQR